MKLSRRAVKDTLRAEDKTREREQQNVSLRKDKRDAKLKERRIYTGDAPACERVTTEFFKLAKENVVQATRVAWQNVCKTSDPGVVLDGLQQLQLLLSVISLKSKIDIYAAYNALEKNAFCKHMCALLKTKDTRLNAHIKHVALILTQVNNTIKDNEAAWMMALSQSGLFPDVIGIHIRDNPAEELRESLFNVCNNYVNVQPQPPAGLVPYVLKCIENHGSLLSTQRSVAWFLLECWRKTEPVLPWQEFGAPFMSFVVTQLKTNNDTEVITDLVHAVDYTIGRSSVARDLVRAVGAERMVHFLDDAQSKTLQLMTLHLLGGISDKTLIMTAFQRAGKLIYDVLERNDEIARVDALIMCRRMVAQGYDQVLRLIKYGYLECTMQHVLRDTCSHNMTLKSAIAFAEETLATLVRGGAWHDVTIFKTIFSSGHVIRALCTQLRQPYPEHRISILAFLHDAIVWQDNLRLDGFVRGQLEDNGDADYIESELQYHDSNSRVNAEAAEVMQVYGSGTQRMDDMPDLVQCDTGDEEEQYYVSKGFNF